MRKRRLLVGALALSLAVVAGGAAPASAARTRVKIVDFAFQPKRVVIPQGSSVTWVNNGDAPHTVTSANGKFDSGELSPGDTYTKRFKQTGVFKYFCEIHPEMRGRVLPGDV
jgi:plastocyanin